MIIVDTGVLSEMMKSPPEPAVLAWISAQVSTELYITSINLAEIKYGIARLPTGRRRDTLRTTADEVFGGFINQILPFDYRAAEYYSRIVVARDEAGTPIDGFDAQITAICGVHGASLATRNTKDFLGTGIGLINPWLA